MAVLASGSGVWSCSDCYRYVACLPLCLLRAFARKIESYLQGYNKDSRVQRSQRNESAAKMASDNF
jgi:hypothetical protein